jgi:hypothetical protein
MFVLHNKLCIFVRQFGGLLTFFDIKTEKQSHDRCAGFALGNVSVSCLPVTFSLLSKNKTMKSSPFQFYHCPESGAVAQVKSAGNYKYEVVTCTKNPASISLVVTVSPACFFGWAWSDADTFEVVRAETLNSLGLMDASATHEAQIAAYEAREADKYACSDLACFDLY